MWDHSEILLQFPFFLFGTQREKSVINLFMDVSIKKNILSQDMAGFNQGYHSQLAKAGAGQQGGGRSPEAQKIWPETTSPVTSKSSSQILKWRAISHSLEIRELA